MFEDTTNYDVDDELDIFFTPVFSSTQGLPGKQRPTEDLLPTNTKKSKLEIEVTNNQRQLLKRKPGFESLSKSKDNSFCSPSKVVKRIFPGPAGLLPDRLEGNKSISELISEEHVDQAEEFLLCSQRTVSVFGDGPWKSMTEDFSTPNQEQLYEKFNINWIKQSSALKKQVVSYSAPFLAAIIQSVTIDGDGKMPTVSVTLKDSTGVIEGTILYSLFEENLAAFTVGSVLVLKQFGVLCMENSYCVTITPNNLLRIYYSNVGINRTMCNTQIRQCTVEKIIVQESSVEEIWKKYEDYLVESCKQQKAASEKHCDIDSSKPNLRKLSNCKNSFPKPFNEGLFKTVNKFTSQENDTLIPDISPFQAKIVGPVAVGMVKKFDFKKTSNSGKQNGLDNTAKHIGSSVDEDDSVTINCSQISVKTDKEHTEIWKNLFEEVDTDALFDDF